MPQSEETLIAAAETAAPGSENRLTTILATVLDLHHGLASALFARRGLDAGTRVRCYTQEWLDAGCQPDMVARSRDESERPLAELWFENKKDSGFRLNQLSDYRDALARLPGRNSLIALVTDEEGAPTSDDWEVLTWQGLAELSDGLGRDWKGADWRDGAMRPEAPAMWRFLHEFIVYLEREGLAVIEAVDKRSVEVFQHVASSMERIEMLLEEASKLTLLPTREEAGGRDDWSALWQRFETPAQSWLNLRIAPLGLEGWPELSLWADEALDTPAASAGYTLPGSLLQALSTNDDFVAQANELGFRVGDWDGHARVMRVEPLLKFVEADDSLVTQAQGLARFAREAIEDVANLDPGELSAPPRRGALPLDSASGRDSG